MNWPRTQVRLPHEWRLVGCGRHREMRGEMQWRSHRPRLHALLPAMSYSKHTVVLLLVVVDMGFTTLLTSQVNNIAFYSERGKSDKCWSEVLTSAWDSFTCRKSTTRDPRLYCPSEGSHILDFFALKKIHRPRPGLNPRTSDLVASMVSTGPPGRLSRE